MLNPSRVPFAVVGVYKEDLVSICIKNIKIIIYSPKTLFLDDLISYNFPPTKNKKIWN